MYAHIFINYWKTPMHIGFPGGNVWIWKLYFLYKCLKQILLVGK